MPGVELVPGRAPKGAADLRVVVLTQWFPPEKTWLPADVARDLARRGHDVTVLTGFPNYPTGKVYPGWRQRPWADYDGVDYRIRRVGAYPSHDNSPIKRSIGYLSFALASTVFGWRLLRRADAVYVYHPPLTSVFGPWLNRVVGGAPYILHVLDLWPDSVVTSDLVNGRARSTVGRILGRACQAAYRRAAGVICIAPTMGGMLAARGVPAAKLHVVLNWADESVFAPASRDDEVAQNLGLAGVFTVMFAGNIGPAQGLDSAIRAAALVSDLADFRLAIVGAGIARASLETLANDVCATNVEFISAQPLESMNAVCHAADVQLVCLRDLEFFRGTIPSKLGAVLASGLPVICAVNGDAGQVVLDAGAGWVCPAEETVQLAAAFRAAHAATATELSSMGVRARAYYERHLSRDVATGRISAVLEASA
jgi:colanic acid biosynthesis glycosyl transferase WcaI